MEESNVATASLSAVVAETAEPKKQLGRLLRVLLVEDSEDDVKLLLEALRRGHFKVDHTVVETSSEMRKALRTRDWDVITSDHRMPSFSASAALALARELRPDIPFIIVSGEIDLELAVSLMRSGALDFVQKRELPRLVPAIEHALANAKLLSEKQEVKDALAISEARYRRLFETAQDGILILDGDNGLILDVNPFLVNMLGYSLDEFLGKNLWEIGAFKDIEASRQAVVVLQREGYVRYEDLPLETKSGNHIDVEFVSNVYYVDKSRVAQCNIRDITVRKRAENALQSINAALEERVEQRTGQLVSLNQQLEAFNHSVSHDLRAPLRHIMGHIQSLRQDDSAHHTAESMETIENIVAGAGRMNLLVEALLELSSYSFGILLPLTIDLSAMAKLVAADLILNDPDRNVAFAVAEGVTTIGDGELLRIVLENVLGNAWKFTSKMSSAHIEFGVTLQAEGSSAFFVRDDGAGFDETYMDKLFGPFQRLHSQKEFPGTGVGLATVQRIISRHGGRVWAESQVGKGATFYFTVNTKTRGAKA